jgi:hypothetical protein
MGCGKVYVVEKRGRSMTRGDGQMQEEKMWYLHTATLLVMIKESRVRQGTYVDHNGLLAKAVKSHGGIDRTPIELDGAANTIDTATENNCAVVIEGNIMGRGVVGGVLLTVSTGSQNRQINIPSS